MRRTTLALATCVSIALISGCSEGSNGPDDHGEQEVINRIEFETLEVNSTTRVTYVWEDADGPGGNNPNRIDTIKLDSAVSYTGTIRMYNTTVSPIIDVTQEIMERLDEHQFFFTVVGGMLTISPRDIDSRGLPVGLSNVIAPAKKGAGDLTIELSHYDSPADKDGTTRSDETDVSVTFPVVVR